MAKSKAEISVNSNSLEFTSGAGETNGKNGKEDVSANCMSGKPSEHRLN